LNVAKAIGIAHPWGVDASSGLESAPGIKDHEKVRQFVLAAKQAAAQETTT
jgi:phosphoribosylanthranilate isomerase